MKTIHHDHVVVYADVRKVPAHHHRHKVEGWLRELVENQGMEVIEGPGAAYVDEPKLLGWSVGCLIKTSHCVCHIWDEDMRIELDFYTCGTLNFDQLIKDLADFDPYNIRYWHYKRDNGMQLVGSGTLPGGVNSVDTPLAEA